MAIIDNTSIYLQPLDYSNLPGAEQALVDLLITMSQELLETKECNRIFEQATYTETLDGTDESSIFIANPPIGSITSIKRVANDDTTTTLDTDSYRFYVDRGEIRLLTSYFVPGIKNYEIIYVGGYLAADIPEPVKKLVADMAMEAFDPNLNEDIMQKEKLGDYFYDKVKGFSDQLLVNKKRIVNRYRIWSV